MIQNVVGNTSCRNIFSTNSQGEQRVGKKPPYIATKALVDGRRIEAKDPLARDAEIFN